MFQFELDDVLFQLPLKTPQFQPLLALQPNNREEQQRHKAQMTALLSYNPIAGDTPAPPYRGLLRMGSAAALQAEPDDVRSQRPLKTPQSQPAVALQPNNRMVLPAEGSGTYC